MRSRSRVTVLLTPLILLSLNSSPQPRAGIFPWSEAKGKPIVLFAFWPPQKDKVPPDAILDTIVGMDKEHYILPPNGDSSEQFEHQYFAADHQYPLFFGGERIGYVKVKKAIEGECGPPTALQATVDAIKHIKISMPNLALASTSDSFHTHRNMRRAATQSEKLQVIVLANHWFQQIGIQPRLLRKTKIDDIVATDLSGHGQYALIANLSVLAPEAGHHLFLIAEPTSAGVYKISVTGYHFYQDITDHTDDEKEEFVDQLDLDGHGIDEVITIITGNEDHQYQVYERQSQPGWAVVYKGDVGC